MIIRKLNNNTIDFELVGTIAKKLDLPFKFVELLFSRNLTDEDKIRKFIFSEQNDFYDPFLFSDMSAIVERISHAANQSETVVVYCDYDADGICAGAILSLFLSTMGINVYSHIPSRTGEGYGLNKTTLERIIEEATPDLIITCDCGISGAAEVELIKDLGVDIIVTDHHEIPETIPDCLILNPHMPQSGYPFADLCGAGVAFKLVQALAGKEKAEEYLDLAAIATVADLVSLTDENRLIVQRGLKKIKQGNNLGLSMLLERNQIQSIDSVDIAFKIAPRINAAGRMGDPSRAFTMLTSSDINTVKSMIDEIERDNDLRKTVCDTMYQEAVAELSNESLFQKRSIVLSNPSWEKGITGIVAARLAGEFHRPSFVLVSSKEAFKGTARSIAGINVYEMLKNASDLLTEFGGHAQAAGFSIMEENIEPFKERIEEYLQQFDENLFLPSAEYDIELCENEISKEFIMALDKLSPYGNSNPRPLFLLQTGIKSVEPFRNNPLHTNVATDGGKSIMAFNFNKKNQILAGKGKKELIIELKLSDYGGFRGFMKTAATENLVFDAQLAHASYLKLLAISSHLPPKKTPYVELPKQQGIFGTMYICGLQSTYERFVSSPQGKQVALKEFMLSTDQNNLNRIIVSPEFDSDLNLSLYNRIVFLDSPPSDAVVSYINSRTKAEVFVPQNGSGEVFQGISTDRRIFGNVFLNLKKVQTSQPTVFDFYHKMPKKEYSLPQFIVCLAVFMQLGLVEVKKTDKITLKINETEKTQLENSEIYNMINKFQQ
jgi:single-stranded-DNA-specific exonuclease